MNKLEKLIAQLCPDGVEYKPLGEVATDFYRGNGILRTQVTAEGTPCVRYGEIYTTYGVWFDECVSHTKLEYVHSPKWIEYGDIVFAITGEKIDEIGKSTAYVGQDKCLAGGDIVVMRHKQNPKYISYALATFDAQKQKSKGKVKSKVVHSSVPELKGVVIPLPPLAVQQEIVRMLDGMAGLIGELEQELAARKQQYEWCRDKLLRKSMLGSADVDFKSLGEICARHHGTAITAGKMAQLASEDGDVRVFAAGSTVANISAKKIPSKDVVREPGIVVKSRGYVGFEFCESPFTHKNELWSYTAIGKNVDLKFIFYYLQTREESLQKLARSKSVKLPQLATGDTDELEIPLPPLAMQKEIVGKLDGMTGLIDELERERNARKQQYEYYRDRLLTFERAG